MHVAAGAEIVSRAGHYDCLDVLGVGHGAKQIAQFGVGIEGERVLSRRTIQRDRRDPAGSLVVEMPAGVACEQVAITRQIVWTSGKMVHATPIFTSLVTSVHL